MMLLHTNPRVENVLKGGSPIVVLQLLTDAHLEESGDAYMYQKTAKDLFSTDDWRNAVCTDACCSQ
jgi:hypothetical protein